MKSAVKYPTLMTPRAKNIDRECPFSTYPRPQMVRDSYLCLNGPWKFTTNECDALPSVYDRTITVPYPPESALSGIEEPHGKGEFLFYERKFSLPDGFLKNRLILHFGAVDQVADVYVNGKHAVHHEGGYTPFFADITDFLSGDEERITVRAEDNGSTRYPYGKQRERRGGMWYTPVSGIWQTVWLESLPESPILSMKIEQTTKFAKIIIKTEAENAILHIDESGEEIEFASGEALYAPKSPHNWTPDDPYLYTFEVRTATDSVRGYFALREIGIETLGAHKRLTLNGKPYFFSGLLDQGYFPDGIFTPADAESYADDILAAKALGFNMLRKHIKVEPLIFYYFCDKLGMAVFQDMVNNSDYSFVADTALPTIGLKIRLPFRHKNPDTRAAFERQMTETARLLYNSPSVLEYTVFNEGWGEFLPDEMYRKLKALDPSRLIDTASGWFSGSLSDFDSRHIYFKLPKIKGTDGSPLFLSEFGGYSLRCEGHLYGSKNYGYSLFESESEFADAFERLYIDGVLPLIKDLRLCAAVYTQLTDVEDETNGLLTYDRLKCKLDPERARALNAKLFSAANGEV